MAADLKNKRISGYREKYCSDIDGNVPVLCVRENGAYSEKCVFDCRKKRTCPLGGVSGELCPEPRKKSPNDGNNIKQ